MLDCTEVELVRNTTDDMLYSRSCTSDTYTIPTVVSSVHTFCSDSRVHHSLVPRCTNTEKKNTHTYADMTAHSHEYSIIGATVLIGNWLISC